jgi:phage tail sheath protein FI
VPAFLGYAEKGEPCVATSVMLWSQYVARFGVPSANGPYLGWCVRGFFDNEGQLMYVVRLDETRTPADALRAGLETIAPLEQVDLICAPDIMRNADHAPELQNLILEHCAEAKTRFAILDSRPGVDLREAVTHRKNLRGIDGALYYPWLHVRDRAGSKPFPIPPSGHVAGIYNRTDRATGVFKSPANEEVAGISDVAAAISSEDQQQYDSEGTVNCLRAFAGRGIRVWGARTVSAGPDWKYVAVRRLYLTIARSVDRILAGAVFEPNGPVLWARVRRELNDYLSWLFRAGAFRGTQPQEAFFVKCDAETTTEECRELGQVVVEIGFAPACPNEFIIVRFVHDSAQQSS